MKPEITLHNPNPLPPPYRGIFILTSYKLITIYFFLLYTLRFSGNLTSNTLPIHFHDTLMSHNNTIPLPDLNHLLAHPHSFIIQNTNHFNPTNHKFLKFYLFTLWFFLHFKHSINTHDFNLIINSIFISFHNNSHNAFDYYLFKINTIHLFEFSHS